MQVAYTMTGKAYAIAAKANDPHGVDFLSNVARSQVCPTNYVTPDFLHT